MTQLSERQLWMKAYRAGSAELRDDFLGLWAACVLARLVGDAPAHSINGDSA